MADEQMAAHGGRPTGRLLLGVLALLGLMSIPGYVAMAMGANAWRSPEANQLYVWIAIPLFAIYLVACYLVLRWGARLPARATLVVIGVIAVSTRAVLVPAAPTLSNDVYRYVWDGRVMSAGISPYRYSPGAEELAPLHEGDDAVWPYINRKSAITIYPPGAELFYAVVYKVYPDSMPWTKAAMVLIDLANCLLIALLLRRFAMPAARSLVYAWSPLPILEFGSSGHVETLSVFWTLLALLAGVIAVQSYARNEVRRGQIASIASGVAMAAAALVKLIPLILIVGWVRRFGLRIALLAVGIFVAVYAGFTALTGGYISPFLLTYLGKEDSNSAVYFLSAHVVGAALGVGEGVVRIALGLATLVGFALIMFRRERGPYDFIGKSFLLVAVYLLFATNAHPWYATWLLAFLPLLLPPNGLPLFGDHAALADRVRWRLGYYGPALGALSYTVLTFSGYLVPALQVQFVPVVALIFQLAVALGLGAVWPLAARLYASELGRGVRTEGRVA
jgi:hypothetical protein